MVRLWDQGPRLPFLTSSLLLVLCLQSTLCLQSSGSHASFPQGLDHHVHAFYYLWYGNPANDGRWLHWDHAVLPHWIPEISAGYPQIGNKFTPPDNVHSPFYPARGCYSSRDPAILREHMDELSGAGVSVMVLSWWGPEARKESIDSQGVSTDSVLPIVFRTAEEHGRMKLAFHLEPYPGRSEESVRSDVEYLMDLYENSPALFRLNGLPLFYVYDSYHIHPRQWGRVLVPGGELSVRGTRLDGIFIGLWLNFHDGDELLAGGFDGAYTYFASEGASYGASWRHWPTLTNWARTHNKLFIASVGPGYNDTRIRPWNAAATRPRDGGSAYETAWREAIDARADMVSITSFNEWGEGTQIEPAVPKVADDGTKYVDYGAAPDLYISLTAKWTSAFVDYLSKDNRSQKSLSDLKEEL